MIHATAKVSEEVNRKFVQRSWVAQYTAYVTDGQTDGRTTLWWE